MTTITYAHGHGRAPKNRRRALLIAHCNAWHVHVDGGNFSILVHLLTFFSILLATTIVIVIVVGELTHIISEREQLALLVLHGMFMITFEGRFSFFVLISGFH